MSSINLHTREINVKIVYYGPGLGGKTSTLQYFHRALRPELRGQLVSLATGVDRTLYFDFLPVKLQAIRDFTIRLSLYTVPGQVHYNATRRLVLQGCDGIVFVADSQQPRVDANIESLRNLDDNLRSQGMNPESVPLVFQFNKRDIPGVMSVEQMDADLNARSVPRFETCALTGIGTFEALKAIAKLVLSDLKRKGIYRERRASNKPLKFDEAPVVSPTVEQGLVQALEGAVPDNEGAAPLVVVSELGRGLTFSELWTVGNERDQILALEGEIERGDYRSAIQRADGVLRTLVGEGQKDANLGEALLMLGVYGRHWVRFRDCLASTKPTKADALFCLFLLTDIELRLQSTGVRVEG